MSKKELNDNIGLLYFLELRDSLEIDRGVWKYFNLFCLSLLFFEHMSRFCVSTGYFEVVYSVVIDGLMCI